MAVAKNVPAKLCRISINIAYSMTFVSSTIPQSQFIEKGFRKTKDCEHRDVLLLLLFIHSLICGGYIEGAKQPITQEASAHENVKKINSVWKLDSEWLPCMGHSTRAKAWRRSVQVGGH